MDFSQLHASFYEFLDCFSFFFFNDTATTEIYTLSLHDALPISRRARGVASHRPPRHRGPRLRAHRARPGHARSEEHTSELQSQSHLVCRLLLEKKKHIRSTTTTLASAINFSTTPTLPASP